MSRVLHIDVLVAVLVFALIVTLLTAVVAVVFRQGFGGISNSRVAPAVDPGSVLIVICLSTLSLVLWRLFFRRLRAYNEYLLKEKEDEGSHSTVAVRKYESWPPPPK